jgi:coenzyme PQQ precursor peptide PqqA
MADLEQFRRQTRAWLEDNCPPEMRLPGGADADAYWGGRDAKVLIEVPVGMEINKYACAARK